jgi:putative DNA primase/helicase
VKKPDYLNDEEFAAATAGLQGVDKGAACKLHPKNADQVEIERLASLDKITYDRERKDAAKALKIRPPILDALVNEARAERRESDTKEFCADVAPCAHEVSVASVLDEIYRLIAKFIVCDEETKIAATLWVAFTWIVDHVDIAPIALITAPEKECGKSQLLEILRRLSRRSILASNLSPAALFRSIEKYKPTLIIDEADAFLKENEELRGLLNAGHARDQATILRCVGDDHDIKPFSTWAAKAIAGIGKLADTIMSRSIVMPMRRKLPTEKVERLRNRNKREFEAVKPMLARLAEDYGPSIGRAVPDMPQELGDRAQDNWEPLIAIADHAGQDWPRRARNAAVAINGSASRDLSPNEELLADIRAIFQRQPYLENLTYTELIDALCEDATAPWATLNRGQRITPRQLGKRLNEFGISAEDVTRGQKGFRRAQFEEVFRRYLDGKSAPNSKADAAGAAYQLTENASGCIPAASENIENKRKSAVCSSRSGNFAAGRKEILV